MSAIRSDDSTPRKGDFSLTVRREIIIASILFVITICLRLNHLASDPPLGLSKSDDVYTDHPQYTLFARDFVETGDFTPFDDNRFVFFLKSSTTLLSLAIFSLFGVGLFQSNLVGLLLSMGALIAFYVFVRRIAGAWPSLIFLLLICLDYNLLFYGRLPFLEHTMTFLAFLAIAVMAMWNRPIGYAAGGLLLGAAIFFGKVIGLVFLFPFACYIVYRFAVEDNDRQWGKPIAFAAGFAMLTLFWYFFSYAPMKSQVVGYIDEQAISLYGAPEGFRSIDDFVWKMVSFGVNSSLFERMRTVGLLGVGFLAFVFLQALRGQTWREKQVSLNSGKIFIAAGIVAFYGSLMIWNYRPLRYQLVLIYFFYAAAAIVLTGIVQRLSEVKYRAVPLLFYPALFVLALPPVHQLYQGLADHFGWEFSYDQNVWRTVAITALVCVLISMLMIYVRRKQLQLPLSGMRALVVLTILGTSITGMLDYLYWAQRPSFTAIDNARDLREITSAGAVISGPFGPLFGLESGRRAVIHMFGVTKADPDLFTKLPITHLLVDQANEDRARRDYPAVMDSAAHLLTYHVGLEKVRLILIAGHTGNPSADRYVPSDFEMAAIAIKYNQPATAIPLLDRFTKGHPRCVSAYELAATHAASLKEYEVAGGLFKKSVELSPTNYNLNAQLGAFYKTRYGATKDPKDREAGIYYFEQALKYAPTVSKIASEYVELKES